MGEIDSEMDIGQDHKSSNSFGGKLFINDTVPKAFKNINVIPFLNGL